MKTIAAFAAAVAFATSLIVSGVFGVSYVAILAQAGKVEALLGSPLGKIRAYQVSCTTAAGGVSLSDGQTISSALIWINSATPVYVGGGDIDSTHGVPLCTNSASCLSSSLAMDVKEARCLSSSGTVTATVMAGAI